MHESRLEPRDPCEANSNPNRVACCTLPSPPPAWLKEKECACEQTKKTPIQVSDRPPWQLETSIFKARKQESEGKAFVHAKRMAERMVGVDWGARLCSKEKFTAAILREWGKDGTSADERLQKLGEAVEKHYGIILRVFDFYCSLGSASPYQMSLNAFSSFCEESAITDNESQYCRKSDLDTLFIIAKSFSTEKGSKLDKVKDANCLMRFEFIEALVRIAVAKIGKIENVCNRPARLLEAHTVRNYGVLMTPGYARRRWILRTRWIC